MAQIKKHPYPNAVDRTTQMNQILADIFYQYDPYKIKKPPVGRNKYIIVNYSGEDRVEEVKEMVVHSFSINDSLDDPDILAAEPLYDWEQSDFGQWVMQNALETPSWHRVTDFAKFAYLYQIRAKFAGPALTELLLRKCSK